MAKLGVQAACVFAVLLQMPAPALAQAQSQPQPDARADTISTTETYAQSAAVRARFADVDVVLDAPTLTAPRPGYTTQDEMMAFLAARKSASSRMGLISAGTSQQGRDIPVAFFTKEGVQSLDAAKAFPRPVVWFIGQQHGNEPAGGEGMLALISFLASENAASVLDRVTVAVVPRANPDGAAAFTRTAANRADSNRDHMLMLLPETRAIHGAMRELPADVVFDHHEFSVANRWLEKFNAIQGVDIMLLHATNPLVAREISGLAEDLYRPAIDTLLKDKGLSSFWYYTTSNSRRDTVVSMGGNNPGIARNAFGLRGAVSFLVETRGVGIAKDGWQRRVATHFLTAKAVLEATASNADSLKAALAAGREAVARSTSDLVIQARIPTQPVEIPLIDPQTAGAMPTVVPFQDSRRIEPTQVRSRPVGYIMLRGSAEAEAKLRLAGVKLCEVSSPVEADVEAFSVTVRQASANRESINPDANMAATIVMRRLQVAPGSIFVPMRQAAAGVVVAALEPDTPGSYLGVGVIAMQPGEVEAPVYRISNLGQLALRPRTAADTGACGS